METAEQAVKREILEELGVELGNLRYLGSAPNPDYHYKGITYQTTDMAFVGTVEDTKNNGAGEQVRRLKWVALQNIDITLFCFESIQQIVALYKGSVQQ